MVWEDVLLGKWFPGRKVGFFCSIRGVFCVLGAGRGWSVWLIGQGCGAIDVFFAGFNPKLSLDFCDLLYLGIF